LAARIVNPICSSAWSRIGPARSKLRRNDHCELRSGAFALVRLAGAGDLFMPGGPERMLLAAIPIRIGFRRNVLSRGALACSKGSGSEFMMAPFRFSILSSSASRPSTVPHFSAARP
jgi:hypothetical protein